MPTTTGRGPPIHYEELGDPRARPVLLVMGMGFSSAGWDRLPARLAERFRVIVFDNRGTGRTPRPRGLYRTRDLADDAARVLDAAGVRRAGVFGISMGGMIAQELALRHGDRLSALALGATFGDWLRSKKASGRTLLDLALLVAGRPGRKARLQRLIVSDEMVERAPAEVARFLKRGGLAEPATTLTQMIAVARHRALDRLEALRVPTLVLSGDADRLVPVENSRELARRIPHARLVELPGAGHVFPFEREDATVDALVTHFTSHD